jgi:hypothetical protein
MLRLPTRHALACARRICGRQKTARGLQIFCVLSAVLACVSAASVISAHPFSRNLGPTYLYAHSRLKLHRSTVSTRKTPRMKGNLRPELQPALDLATTLARSDLPSFLGAVEEIRVVALARLASPPVEARLDQLLDVPQAAARLNVSENYLYRNSRRLPFTRRVGRKLLFSSSGLDLYLKKSR